MGWLWRPFTYRFPLTAPSILLLLLLQLLVVLLILLLLLHCAYVINSDHCTKMSCKEYIFLYRFPLTCNRQCNNVLQIYALHLKDCTFICTEETNKAVTNSKKKNHRPQPLAVQSAGKDGAFLSIKSSPPHLDIGKEGGGEPLRNSTEIFWTQFCQTSSQANLLKAGIVFCPSASYQSTDHRSVSTPR